MVTSYWVDAIWSLWMTLTLAVGSAANGEIVIRNEGYIEYCDAEEFHARCEQDEVVYMQNALYGRMRTGRCVDTNYGYVGCGKDVLHLADWMCSGRPHCRIPVPNSAFKKVTDCPKDLKPYFEAGYECIKVETAPDQHCQSTNFVLPSSTTGYLSNHVAIETRKGSEDCPWMIQGRYGQTINFTLFDFARKDLRNHNTPSMGSAGICRVYAVVREKGKLRGDTICSGNHRISHAYTSSTHVVEVRILGKKDNDNPEFFLLKYEIIGCTDPDLPENSKMKRDGDVVEIVCPLTNQKWRLICDGNSWSGTYGNCSQAARQATFGEIVWGNLFMTFEMSLTIVVGIAVGIGIVILACGVICIRSACKPKKKPRKPQTMRPVNSVPPQRMPSKRIDTKGPLPPPPRSPGGILRPENTHGPLPPPPAFLMDNNHSKEVCVTENEYSYIAEMPPPPPSPTPPITTPLYPDIRDTVIVNEMASHRHEWSDSDPDYTSPPTPYTSPRHTHYDVNSLRSSEDNLASDCEIPVKYFYKNNYPAADPHENTNFSMKIYTKPPPEEEDLQPFYDEDPDLMVPYDGHLDSPNAFCGSLQSRYWRNKYTGACIPNLHASKASLYSRSGGGTM